MSAGAVHLPIRPGDVIAGKYAVVSVLGEGGMGYVVAARHLALGQLVAIKLLLPSSVRSEEAIARFLREARAVVAMTSDHVARTLDFGTSDDGVPFIVMEHLTGDTLATLAERGPMPVRDAIGFMLEVGEALTEAHGLGIIHRDLKPENVFIVQKASGKRYAKVLDFGVSRIDNPEIAGGMRALTATGAAIGTPAFMAPEQISPKKPPGAKVDVWALGATLYCALTARLPFESASVYELPIKIHGEPPTPIRTHRPDLSDALVRVIDDCLTKDPDARPALSEILARLEAVRAAESSRGLTTATEANASMAEPAPQAARSAPDVTVALQRPPMMTPRDTVLASATAMAPHAIGPHRTVSALTLPPVPAPSNRSPHVGKLLAFAVACAAIGLLMIGGSAIRRQRHAAKAISSTSGVASSATPVSSSIAEAAPAVHPPSAAEPEPSTPPTPTAVTAPASGSGSTRADAPPRAKARPARSAGKPDAGAAALTNER